MYLYVQILVLSTMYLYVQVLVLFYDVSACIACYYYGTSYTPMQVHSSYCLSYVDVSISEIV